MRKEKNPLLLADLPEYVIQNYMINDDLSVHQQARRALEKALPRYFDKKGNFTRLTVSFPFRMYEVDDKKGKGSETFRRLTFCVTKEILDQLDEIKLYTYISRKSVAEILIMTELLRKKGGKNAENSSLSYK